MIASLDFTNVYIFKKQPFLPFLYMHSAHQLNNELPWRLQVCEFIQQWHQHFFLTCLVVLAT